MTLATAVEKARCFSMPKDNIERAIERATGGAEGSDAYEEIVYEGYGPGRRRDHRRGADRQPQPHRGRRAARSSRSTTASLGAPGSVAWQFDRKGVIEVPAEGTTRTTSSWRPPTPAPRMPPSTVAPGRSRPRRPSWRRSATPSRRTVSPWSRPSCALVPRSTVGLDEDGARKLLRLIDGLEDLDDVQDVYANFDIPDAVLEAVAG